MNKQISLELLNEIANYLANRPFIEVNNLIQKIAQLEDVAEVKKPEEVQDGVEIKKTT